MVFLQLLENIGTYDIDAEIDGLWRQKLYPITLISSIDG